ncbi:uncharacterized protein A4U43_C06F13340, partial [Asparagus officinalis]
FLRWLRLVSCLPDLSRGYPITVESWARGSQEQSRLLRRGWTSWILSSVARFATMGAVLNAASLTEPIDIYSEWIDECERVNNLEEDGA